MLIADDDTISSITSGTSHNKSLVFNVLVWSFEVFQSLNPPSLWNVLLEQPGLNSSLER